MAIETKPQWAVWTNYDKVIFYEGDNASEAIDMWITRHKEIPAGRKIFATRMANVHIHETIIDHKPHSAN